MGVRYRNPADVFGMNSILPGIEITDLKATTATATLDSGGHEIPQGTRIWLWWEGGNATRLDYELKIEFIEDYA